MGLLAVALALLLSGGDGSNLIGRPCPEWAEHRWVQGGPRRLADLKGKVVLIRFFMDPDCPLCRGTAPGLNALQREFGPPGLVIIGMFTPKPRPRPVTVEEARRATESYGFTFPVAIDDQWETLRRLWLDRVPDAAYTSASLLVDRRGTVRHVQKGGLYSPDAESPEARADWQAMREAIEWLLEERS